LAPSGVAQAEQAAQLEAEKAAQLGVSVETYRARPVLPAHGKLLSSSQQPGDAFFHLHRAPHTTAAHSHSPRPEIRTERRAPDRPRRARAGAAHPLCAGALGTARADAAARAASAEARRQQAGACRTPQRGLDRLRTSKRPSVRLRRWSEPRRTAFRLRGAPRRRPPPPSSRAPRLPAMVWIASGRSMSARLRPATSARGARHSPSRKTASHLALCGTRMGAGPKRARPV
jgi:hypothetical protein